MSIGTVASQHILNDHTTETKTYTGEDIVQLPIIVLFVQSQPRPRTRNDETVYAVP